jgi:hypothetical protein
MTVAYALAALLIPVVLIGFCVWVWLVHSLYRRLKADHPDKFRDIGEPGIFSNNTRDTNRALNAFLFQREDRALNDSSLSRLTLFMVAYAVVFLAFCAYEFVCALSLPLLNRGP